MASFNKVILLGNLTRDPEMRTTNSGLAICRFGLATSRVVRGNEGESREEVVFVDVDAFGKQAELIGRYFSKGRPIFIEGRLRLDQWESNTGEKRSKLLIVVENFQFVGGNRADEGGSGDSIMDLPSSSNSANENSILNSLKKGSSLSDPSNNASFKPQVRDELDEDVPF